MAEAEPAPNVEAAKPNEESEEWEVLSEQPVESVLECPASFSDESFLWNFIE